MDATFIYALCEPGTKTVRYIGKANNPDERLRRHLSKSSRLNTHLGHWIRQLSSPPEMIILQEVPLLEWKSAESLYIRNARALGMRLVNATAGGEGCQDPSEETRNKMRAAAIGRKMSPEAIKKMSLASSLRHIPHTQETKDKIRSSLLGHKHSEESRKKMSEALQGPKNHRFGKKHSLETKNRMRASALKWRAERKAAK